MDFLFLEKAKQFGTPVTQRGLNVILVIYCMETIMLRARATHGGHLRSQHVQVSPLCQFCKHHTMAFYAATMHLTISCFFNRVMFQTVA